MTKTFRIVDLVQDNSFKCCWFFWPHLIWCTYNCVFFTFLSGPIWHSLPHQITRNYLYIKIRIYLVNTIPNITILLYKKNNIFTEEHQETLERLLGISFISNQKKNNFFFAKCLRIWQLVTTNHKRIRHWLATDRDVIGWSYNSAFFRWPLSMMRLMCCRCWI